MSLSPALRNRIIDICDAKVAAKGPDVGLSFYAFFKQKNTDPQALMAVATWWIETHRLDHFEKATRIRVMMAEGL